MLGINEEDYVQSFSEREHFLKTINAKAKKKKKEANDTSDCMTNLYNNEHHKQSENSSEEPGKNT